MTEYLSFTLDLIFFMDVNRLVNKTLHTQDESWLGKSLAIHPFAMSYAPC